ncbi:ATP-grasp domain-containing protein [Glycocaulis sp.]|uniref:ATP-grasp domain-containing protein n=1 Tax=Glycocaulis sp. TaxID=1969725 RepID=UPI003D257FCC
MKQPVVIITYARSLMALTIAESCRDLAGRIVAADSVDMTPLGFSKHCDEAIVTADCRSDPEGFVNGMVEACARYAGEAVIIMPVFEEMELLARERHRFPAHVTIAAPDAAAIAKVTPKHHLAETISGTDIPAPATEIIGDGKSGLKEPEGFTYPFLVKPSEGAGGRGISKIESGDELDAYAAGLREKDVILAQSLAPGEDYCVSALCRQGELVICSAYTNLEQFPKEHGAGVVRETVDTAPFVEAVRRIARETGWDGIFEADFMWTGNKDDTPLLIEINARFWAGVRHSKLSGVDYPRLLLEQTLFGRIQSDPGVPEIGHRSKVPMIWMPSAVSEAFSETEYAEKLSEAWEHLQASDGNLFERVGRFLGTLGSAKSAGEAIDDIVFRLTDRSDLDIDLMAEDDPRSALGVLFIASHLARFGKLPPEISYKPMD